VLAYSRAGYGQSDSTPLPRPLNYMTLEATDVLPKMLNALGIEQAIFLGHSDGATIAAIHAGKINDPRVKGVVLMAPHFFTEEIALNAIQQAKDAYEHGELKPSLAKYHKHVDTAFRGWNDAWLHPNFKRWNVTDVLDSIAVPVLAIQGLQDQYGTAAQLNIIKQRCTNFVDIQLLDNCRHSPFLDCSSAVLKHVAQFCRMIDHA